MKYLKGCVLIKNLMLKHYYGYHQKENMMIKIIENNYIPKIERTKCENCNSVLEYDEKDIELRFGKYSTEKMIRCPVCNRKISLKLTTYTPNFNFDIFNKGEII